MKVIQSCTTLCDSMDYGLPDSSIHRILQARILGWVAISYSRGSSWPREPTHVSCISCIGRQILYQLCHVGNPYLTAWLSLNYLPRDLLLSLTPPYLQRDLFCQFPQNTSSWSSSWIPFKVYSRSVTTVANNLIILELDGWQPLYFIIPFLLVLIYTKV